MDYKIRIADKIRIAGIAIIIVVFIYMGISCWHLVGLVVVNRLSTQQSVVLISIIGGWFALVITVLRYLCGKDE